MRRFPRAIGPSDVGGGSATTRTPPRRGAASSPYVRRRAYLLPFLPFTTSTPTTFSHCLAVSLPGPPFSRSRPPSPSRNEATAGRCYQPGAPASFGGGRPGRHRQDQGQGRAMAPRAYVHRAGRPGPVDEPDRPRPRCQGLRGRLELLHRPRPGGVGGPAVPAAGNLQVPLRPALRHRERQVPGDVRPDPRHLSAHESPQGKGPRIAPGAPLCSLRPASYPCTWRRTGRS
jgi:hypothetical protein